jgi:hypothetical protein
LLKKIDTAIETEGKKNHLSRDYFHRISAEIDYIAYRETLIQIIKKLELPTSIDGVKLLKGTKFSAFVKRFISDYLNHKNIKN